MISLSRGKGESQFSISDVPPPLDNLGGWDDVPSEFVFELGPGASYLLSDFIQQRGVASSSEEAFRSSGQ